MPGFLKLRTERDGRDEPVPQSGTNTGTPVTPVSTTAIALVGRVDKDNMDEISALWKDVEDRVIQLAGGDPRKLRRDLDIAGVIQYIEQSKQKDEATQANYGWIKDKFNKTLQCISTIGGIAADGASSVFGPAQTCYNALSFVIQAWQGYQGIFENLAELFDKCIDFLERLEEYQRWMDIKLKRVACQHLQLFVALCDRSIRLRRKHVKLVAFTKMLFLNDSGIKDLISMMDRLVDKEHGLVTAQVFNFTNEISQNVGALIEGENQRKKEADTKQWKTTLVNALQFEQSMLDRDKEPIPSWTKTFTNFKNSLVEGTGKWILSDPLFDSWARCRDSSRPLLVLHGDDGTGKTHMMANILKYLPALEGLTSRVALAHFFMDSNSKRLESKENMFATVSRSLLWQCASASDALTKSMASICEKTRDFDRTLDLWTKLFFENRDRLKMETIFYIAIDGLDDEIQSILPLLEKVAFFPANMKIRLLLTAKTKTLEFLESVKDITFGQLSISGKNVGDIETYITYRMDSMDILKDTSRPGIPEWRQTILETLRDKTAGDYFKLVTNLDSIAKKDLVEDIEEVLENADKTRTDQIDAEISRLNNTLTANEIREVNEIILWLITGEEWPSLGEMDAVLALKHGTGSVSASLLPLDLKLKTKYPLFQVSQAGWVQWKSDEIEDRIPKRNLAAIMDTGSGTSGEMQEVEVNIVEHFLKQVCTPDLFEKFEFRQFFDQKRMTRSRNTICQDADNADINIALACLRVLTEERNDRTGELKIYAGRYLLSHLRDVDLSLADRELKTQIGPRLLQLFTTGYGIDSLFWAFEHRMSQKTWMDNEHKWLADNRERWLYKTDGVEELKRWFNDSAVMKGVEDQEQKDFIAAFTAPEANLHEVLLKPAAKHLAAHLLRQDGFSMREANSTMFFLLGYMSKIDNASENDQITSDYWSATMEEIDRVEKWAKSVFEEQDIDSLWEAQMAFTIGDMCRDEGAEAAALGRAQKARQLDPNNWLACQFVASHSEDNEAGHLQAIQILEDAIGKIESQVEEGSNWLEGSYSHQTLLAFMFLELGTRYWDLGKDYVKAAEAHRKSLRYSQSRFSQYGIVFGRYRDKQDWSAVISFMEVLNLAKDWPGYFDELVNDLMLDTNIQITLASAAEAQNRWDIVESMFNQAIDIAKDNEYLDELFRLRRAYGFTLNNIVRKEDMQIAIWEDALRDGIPRVAAGEEITRTDLFEIADPLARIYLRRGVVASLSVEKSKEYATKIARLFQDADAWSNVVVSCCLARFHQKWGEIQEAKSAVRDLMLTIMELLSDDDSSNDLFALIYLARVVTTFGDKRNTTIVWHLANAILHKQKQERLEWEATQTVKPTAAEDGETGVDTSLVSKEEGAENRTTGPNDAVVIKAQTEDNAVDANGTGRDGSDKQTPTGEDSVPVEDRYREKSAAVSPEHCEPSPNEAHKHADRSAPESLVEAHSGSASVTSYIGPASERNYGPPDPDALVACDGCGEDIFYLNEVYTCADCVGLVQFDTKCYGLMRGGELSKEGCSKDHEFVFIPAWDEARATVLAQGSVLIDGSILKFEEWKKQLRESYLDSLSESTLIVGEGP